MKHLSGKMIGDAIAVDVPGMEIGPQTLGPPGRGGRGEDLERREAVPSP